MLILMHPDATRRQIEAVRDRIKETGLEPHEIPGSMRVAIGITGNQGALSPEQFMHLAGVAECVPVSRPYKLVSREVKPEPTIVDVDGVKIGDGSLAVIAGPCSVESRDQIFRSAEAVAKSGVKLFRGGAFKPRTSPYAFHFPRAVDQGEAAGRIPDKNLGRQVVDEAPEQRLAFLQRLFGAFPLGDVLIEREAARTVPLSSICGT